jgi:hypothetical protein
LGQARQPEVFFVWRSYRIYCAKAFTISVWQVVLGMLRENRLSRFFGLLSNFIKKLILLLYLRLHVVKRLLLYEQKFVEII